MTPKRCDCGWLLIDEATGCEVGSFYCNNPKCNVILVLVAIRRKGND